VPLEKDIAFIENYIAMEKARYPEADISFTVKGNAGGQQIVPLLFIQFIENSFKHGAHRVTDNGYIHGSLELKEGRLHFHIVNDMLPPQLRQAAMQQGASENSYGGIGMQNVQKRLELIYPDRHKINIKKEEGLYEVTIDILLLPIS
jgi:LytS/YehU family sensor histidine kinase